jgi:hypothetical protein
MLRGFLQLKEKAAEFFSLSQHLFVTSQQGF